MCCYQMFKDGLYHSKNWYSSAPNLQVHLVSNFMQYILKFRAKLATSKCILATHERSIVFLSSFENRFSLFNSNLMDMLLH